MITHIKHLICSLILLVTITSCQKDTLYGDKDYQTLGTSAHDLLASDKFQSLIVQISYMQGYQPEPETITALENFLRLYLNKPGGISVTIQQIPASGRDDLSLKQIVETEKKVRSVYSAANVLGVHVLITDGFSLDRQVLASSYWNTSLCVFGKTVYELTAGGNQTARSRLMSILLQHEFGHLLGLVNQGSPMQVPHRDSANGAHCSNEKCLMNYGIETGNPDPLAALPTLDADCIADLKANGGR
jgi:hypothetical protein